MPAPKSKTRNKEWRHKTSRVEDDKGHSQGNKKGASQWNLRMPKAKENVTKLSKSKSTRVDNSGHQALQKEDYTMKIEGKDLHLKPCIYPNGCPNVIHNSLVCFEILEDFISRPTVAASWTSPLERGRSGKEDDQRFWLVSQWFCQHRKRRQQQRLLSTWNQHEA